MGNVGYNEKQRKLLTRDAKARSVDHMGRELREKLEELEALKENRKEPMGVTSESPALRLREIEVDVLEDAYRPLSLSLELDDINANAPERIQLIQLATVRQE